MLNLQTLKKNEIGVLAEYLSNDLSVFIVGENSNLNIPANGGLRLLSYETDIDCLQDGFRLAKLMKIKHDLYNTGFSGGKIVARASNPKEVKDNLITITAELLEKLNGRMITGCDLNTDIEDMEKLFRLTPHVLAAVGSSVDASVATAMGVIGAFEAYEKSFNYDFSNGILVHGCGAVGSKVATELVKKGLKTYTVDIDIKKTYIKGATSLGDNQCWYKNKFDVIIPCSISGLITTYISNFLINTKAIISAANAPFANEIIIKKLRNSNVTIIPDPLVNAGAVIGDSIERYSPEKWLGTSKNIVYQFVRDQIRNKCFIYLSLLNSSLSNQESIQLIKNESNEIIGKQFLNK